ncbi:MAG: calcium/sodium antiporter [Lachnospiraceae bacterium]|nr:calcium/sodium antiporter [Lachnospiraceae bacterium]
MQNLLILTQVVLLAVGFFMLVKGADWFVEGAAGIADRFGIPQIVIGLTICAFGTSAPEAAISISAALRGNAALTIGNVVGSNILNILLILGITALITPLAIKKNTFRYEIPFVAVVTLLLLGLGVAGGTVSRMDGGILWLFMILFLVYLFRMAKTGEADMVEEIPEDAKQDPLWKLLVCTIGGMVLIVWGSDITVDSATEIAHFFHMSERLIGLTIVAFGTSLPELITSVTAGIKGKADIAIGNIVGSNIFNILFVVGTAALITPVAFASNFIIDSIIATLAAVMLFVCVAKHMQLRKMSGIVMLVSYAAYFVYLLQ